MNEGAEPGELDVDIRALRERGHAVAPKLPALGRHVFQHAGMFEHEGRRPGTHPPAARHRHLAREYLHFEQQTVIGKQRQSSAPVGVVHDIRPRRKAILRIFVPMQLLADAPCCRQLRRRFEQRSRVGIGEVGMRDIGVRPAGLIGNRLHPLCLVIALPCRPVGLDVDRFDDVAAGDIAAVFGDRIVAADRLIRTENSRHLRP